MKKFITTKWKFLILFVVLFMIGYFVPYSHDDWFWGTNWGIRMFNEVFSNVNGRYAGNLLALVLTRNRLLRALFISITLFLVFIIIKKICKKEKLAIYASIVLLFTVSAPVLKQTVTWTAGFVNYVIPVLGLLYVIYLNLNNIENKENKFSKYILYIMLPLGFINSLFMENLTIYNVCLSLFLIIYTYITKKKIQKENILYLIGAIIGAILMFSNAVYFQIGSGSDSFGERSIGNENPLFDIIVKYSQIISNDLLFNNIILIILISCAAFIILKKHNDRLSKILSIVICGYLGYSVMFKLISIPDLLLKYTDYFNGLLTLGYAIAIFLVVLLYVKENKMLLFLFISAVVIVGPLLVVNPIQSRCMLPPYIFIIVFSILLCTESGIKLSKISFELKIFTIIVLGFMVCIYGYAFKVEIARVNYINNHKTAKILTLPKIPNREYVYLPDPVNNDYLPRFKEFYNISPDVKISFVENTEWKK